MAVIKFCLILLVIYSAVFLTKIKFSNEVVFSGDALDYQTMAVNFVQGYGLMKLGGVAGDYHSVYRYEEKISEIYQPKFISFVESGKTGGYFDFYRTPGYIIFLATIYKLFGVNPATAKIIQLLLVTFIAAFLPYLGWHYWRKSGLVAGWLAGLTYLKEYARNIPRDLAISYPSDIMAEPLIAFSLLLLVFTFIFWKRRQRPIRAAVLGIITGVSILIKGANIFLPLLIGVYLWRQKTSLAAFALGLTLSILPWSIYASKMSGQTVIISTQLEAALLDNNNEYAIDGGWHPEGYSLANHDVFYHQQEIDPLSLPLKLLAFAVAYPERLPSMFLEKIRLGFGGLPYLSFALILIAAKVIGQIYPRTKTLLPILAGVWIIYLYKYPTLFNISRPFFRFDLLLLGVMLIIVLAALIYKRSLKLDLPPPLVILFLNYLLLTLVIMGWPRLNQVIDFAFMLVFFKYLIDFVKIPHVA